AGATLVGLLATGSRGGWIASGLLLTLVMVVAAVRAFRSKRGRTSLVVALSSLLIVLGAAGYPFRDTITTRLDMAREQITAAREGRYEGTDGARLAMKHAAIDAFVAHPIAGVGTGGFSAWADEHSADATEIHDHAHDTLLHVAASNGLIGVGLLLALAAVGIVQGLRWTRETGLGAYAAGPACALIGLVLTTPFDTLHVSGSAAAVTGMVLALCAHPPGGEGFVFPTPIRPRTRAESA
ncbi:MAG: O-antigen ligase family protein, partial [Phycisphaerales bacterium]|nr:O-antigen ligase family protein [Phycisphaerales bacterium]